MAQTFEQKAQGIRDNTTNVKLSINEELIYDELILRAINAGTSALTPIGQINDPPATDVNNPETVISLLKGIEGFLNGQLQRSNGANSNNPFTDVTGAISDFDPYLLTIAQKAIISAGASGAVNTPSALPSNDITDNSHTLLALTKGLLGNLNGQSVRNIGGTNYTPLNDYTGQFGTAGVPYLKTVIDKLVSIVSALPQASGLLATKTLLAAGNAFSLTTTAVSQNTALTVGAKGVSIYAVSSDCYFKIGSGAQIASSSTCYLPQGQRLDFDITGYANPNIAFIFGINATATVVTFNTLI